MRVPMLVEEVRQVSRRYKDVRAAAGAGYEQGAFVDWNTRVSCEGQ